MDSKNTINTTSATITNQTRSRSKAAPFSARPERTISWLGGVNYQNLDSVMNEVKRMLIESPKDEIHLMVNSFGGASGIGMSFYDAMRTWLKPNLVTIGSGDVDSSGIIVFLAGQRRYITQNTTLLFHMAGRTFGTEKRFTVEDMEAMLKEDNLKDYQYACVVSDATNGRYTPERVLEMMRKNTILTADEAVQMGLAHKVLG
ncbi:ATP-dependent Clp protease proteolytic subunit [Candidatus Parcubacteria bacterium]|nr:ATP-dependent Clp protease proteolytic subunit [Candidatus Parcubacteria bacterium]